MRLLGLNINGNRIPFSRPKAQLPATVAEEKSQAIFGLSDRGWWPIIRESFTGAWQQNVTVDVARAPAFHAIYSCATLIASDISKNRPKLVANDNNGIWGETSNPAYTPVLSKPNPYQTRIQFFESWVLSKLLRGNAYILKQRDNRGVVTALYVLDPVRVRPLLAEDGSIFYQLQSDYLSGLSQSVTVPAREIIHDRFNCLFHPLIGTSPIFANGLAAMQGLRIQENSARFFGNNSNPGGILTAPGKIDDETANRLKTQWEEKFTGENVGRVAVLGNGLTFERMAITAVDAQLVEQLQWTAEVVCGTFHVPPYKIAIGDPPARTTVEALNLEYYSQCLQVLFEAIEECLNDGLGIGWSSGKRVEFDIDNLLRMDSQTQMTVLKDGVSAGIIAPNEGRARVNLGPVAGGESPYLQQQNYSLAALAKRDASADPFASAKPAGSNANGTAAQSPSAQEQLRLPAPLVALPAPLVRSDSEITDWAMLVDAVTRQKLALRLAA
jgi:HK97 family phage portal protein